MKTELRIGNWVKIDSVSTQNQVTQILEKGVNCGSIGVLYEMIKPIPLTKEWLKRFGFENVSGDYVRYELKASDDVYILYADDYSCGLFNSKESEKDELGVIPNWDTIKHVHQLQNLYFALTGEELTIKE